jgi:hypothetical protein
VARVAEAKAKHFILHGAEIIHTYVEEDDTPGHRESSQDYYEIKGTDFSRHPA